MKSTIQMQVAKHMIAVWMKPDDPDALSDAYGIINQCWSGLSRRVLRTWAKALVKNPERYEFTGYAYKQLKLEDHFSTDEVTGIKAILDLNEEVTTDNYNDVVRSIIHHKYCYGMDAFTAFDVGTAVYFGNNSDERYTRKYRPAKPVLKPIEAK